MSRRHNPGWNQMSDPPFRVCVRPDCTQPPRYCSASCAYELNDAGPTLRQACTLLTRAADLLVAHEMAGAEYAGGGVLVVEIGAFLARARP